MSKFKVTTTREVEFPNWETPSSLTAATRFWADGFDRFKPTEFTVEDETGNIDKVTLTNYSFKVEPVISVPRR